MPQRHAWIVSCSSLSYCGGLICISPVIANAGYEPASPVKLFGCQTQPQKLGCITFAACNDPAGESRCLAMDHPCRDRLAMTLQALIATQQA